MNPSWKQGVSQKHQGKPQQPIKEDILLFEKPQLMRYTQMFIAFIGVILLLPACRNEQPPISSEPEVPLFSKAYIDTHDGYSEAVVVQTGGLNTIYISGQVGTGEDLDSQMRSALSNLEEVLENTGATMGDVVKMNTYIVDYGPQTLTTFRNVRKELLGETDMPASTLVGVEALALPEWLIEIEAVAVVRVKE